MNLLGRVFALGAGLETEALFVPGRPGEGGVSFVIGPSLSPVILRLGMRGEHQLALSVSSLYSLPARPLYFSIGSGALNANVSYSYLF